MRDKKNRSGEHNPAHPPKKRWWAGFINYVKRKFKERRAKREKETPSEKAERRTATATVWIGVFTVVIAVVGVLQWIAISGQLAEMRLQRDFTIAEQRANIRQEETRIDPVGPDGSLGVSGDKISGWEISPRFSNAGSTDARQVRAAWLIIKERVPFFGPVTCSEIYIPREDIPTVLVPGKQFTQKSQHLTMQEAQSAKDGQLLVFMAGRVEYLDIFPGTKPHFVDWCVRVFPNDLSTSRFSFPTFREDSN